MYFIYLYILVYTRIYKYIPFWPFLSKVSGFQMYDATRGRGPGPLHPMSYRPFAQASVTVTTANELGSSS